MNRLVVDLIRGSVSTVQLTAEEVLVAEAKTAALAPEKAALAAAEAIESQKMTGVEILGVMCSATGKDQAGLSAIAVGSMRAQLTGGVFADTDFQFENGSKLTITAANFADIEAIWTPFRQSFFTPVSP